MRYQLFTYENAKKPVCSVPWFWLAHLIAVLFKNEWLEGRVIDTKTGEVPITWELSGHINGDGRAHLTVRGIRKGPRQPTPAQHAAMTMAMLEKTE